MYQPKNKYKSIYKKIVICYKWYIDTKIFTLNSRVNTLKYNFDKANRLTSLKLNDSITWTNTMDSLSRLSVNTITSGSSSYTTNYTYKDVENVTNKTTTLLKTIKNGNNEEITYTYDALGNIETITKGSTLINKYYYDELNKLVIGEWLIMKTIFENKLIFFIYIHLLSTIFAILYCDT